MQRNNATTYNNPLPACNCEDLYLTGVGGLCSTLGVDEAPDDSRYTALRLFGVRSSGVLAQEFPRLLYRFDVLGSPCGFVASGHRKWSRKQGKAWSYAKFVRVCLSAKYGVELLSASKEAPLFICTRAFFFNGVHPDPENVHKLVKDALFHKVRNGDKYTAGLYFPPMYDKETPRVEVYVWDALEVFE